jgi:predicted outer membrane protein
MAATRSLLAVTAGVALGLPACTTDSSGTVVIDDPVGDTVAEGQATGDNLADDAYGELNGDDYLIVVGKTASILAALNDGEINQASFAVQVVAASDVFDFADGLIADHDAANFDLDATVRFYGVGYIPSTAADSLTLEANAGLGELRATPPQDIDFAFVDLQVRMHAAAQVMLDELYSIVGPGEMGDFILDTQDMIDDHLAVATDLLETFY